MSASSVYVGVDVSKAQLDVAVRPSAEGWSTPHDLGGGSRPSWSVSRRSSPP